MTARAYVRVEGSHELGPHSKRERVPGGRGRRRAVSMFDMA